MIAFGFNRRAAPIGLDIGARSVKLVQLSADRTRLIEATRRELSFRPGDSLEEREKQIVEALRHAQESRKFIGRDVVVCLGGADLFVKNVRVPRSAGAELELLARREVQDRLPFALDEASLAVIEAADIRQGDMPRKEVLVVGCHQPRLDRMLKLVEAANFNPVAVDIEPMALVRCYVNQFRRDEDRGQRMIVVHIGAATTAVVIAKDDEPLFMKYIDIGGQHFDEAVATNLGMDLPGAWALRRHNGDRRADQQDPEVARSVAESIRPVLDRLLNEISMCVRYYSVTFRGQPLARLVLGGGEATQSLVDTLGARLDVKCELGDPLRSYERGIVTGRQSQWDVATGLALRAPSKTPQAKAAAKN